MSPVTWSLSFIIWSGLTVYKIFKIENFISKACLGCLCCMMWVFSNNHRSHHITWSYRISYLCYNLATFPFVYMDRTRSVMCAIVMLRIRVPLWFPDCVLRSSQGCRYCSWLRIIGWRIISCDVTTRGLSYHNSFAPLCPRRVHFSKLSLSVLCFSDNFCAEVWWQFRIVVCFGRSSSPWLGAMYLLLAFRLLYLLSMFQWFCVAVIVVFL